MINAIQNMTSKDTVIRDETDSKSILNRPAAVSLRNCYICCFSYVLVVLNCVYVYVCVCVRECICVHILMYMYACTTARSLHVVRYWLPDRSAV